MSENKESLRILHRIYFGFDGKPDPYGMYLKTWTEKLPNFKIMHWDANNLPLDACYFAKKMYELRDHAFLSDYFRWWVLREHGGVYLDADIEIINGELFTQLVDELAVSDKHHSFLGIDNKAGGWYTGHSVACRRYSPLSKFMCEAYEGLGHISIWRRKIFYFMSPQLTSLYFAHSGHNVDGMGTTPNLDVPIIHFGVKIYPQDYFSPLTPVMQNGIGTFEINAHTENTVVCHHFSCSWHDQNSPYIQDKNVNFLTLNEKIKLNFNYRPFNKYKIVRIYRKVLAIIKITPIKLYSIIKSA